MIAISFKSESGDDYLEVSLPEESLNDFVAFVKQEYGDEFAFFNIVLVNSGQSKYSNKEVKKAFQEAIENAQ